MISSDNMQIDAKQTSRCISLKYDFQPAQEQV